MLFRQIQKMNQMKPKSKKQEDKKCLCCLDIKLQLNLFDFIGFTNMVKTEEEPENSTEGENVCFTTTYLSMAFSILYLSHTTVHTGGQ